MGTVDEALSEAQDAYRLLCLLRPYGPQKKVPEGYTEARERFIDALLVLKDLGVTRRPLAAYLGISKTAVTKWTNERSRSA